MKKLKVRKIGNSLGSIFPKDWGVHDGELLSYTIDKKIIE
ncbi:toxin-antitoxin system, antitoxin component, AbrB family [Lactobacillus gasseri 224-1]|uniref:Toxin-antitoxin system, antitoxin component, AbrB family n=1 Tax=Lactobacillus gasseri 224-1 TaxID=679196 RepID=D1YJD0_LACGS|nr:toxin-antitoxin system, antitoxin component, AbrB family [Lactobacillus gasseri 224-1]